MSNWDNDCDRGNRVGNFRYYINGNYEFTLIYSPNAMYDTQNELQIMCGDFNDFEYVVNSIRQQLGIPRER